MLNAEQKARRAELAKEAEDTLHLARAEGRNYTAEEHARGLEIREECDKLDALAAR
jgi:hypothetical protein